jgi:hypothetical protein
MGANRPPSEGVECRLGSSIIKTASPKKYYTPVGSPTSLRTRTTATIPSVSAGSDGKPVALAFGGEVAYLPNGQLMYGSVEQGIS